MHDMLMNFVIGSIPLLILIGAIASFVFGVLGLVKGDDKEAMVLQGFTWKWKLATAAILFGLLILILYIQKNS